MFNGVAFLTPLRMTKNIRTRDPAMRIRDAMPIPLPGESILAGFFEHCDLSGATYAVQQPLCIMYLLDFRGLRNATAVSNLHGCGVSIMHPRNN